MSQFSCPIVTIKSVIKHPDADRLDIISFEENAWTCVDVRDKRKVGDKVVYIPVDAMVDCSRPEFEFLKKNAKMRKINIGISGNPSTDGNYQERPIARIKTIRLRGVISQGLVIDLPDMVKELLPPQNDPETVAGALDLVVTTDFVDAVLQPELDMAYYFGISKYEPPQEAVFSVNAKGTFIDWCPKTDAERYQNVNRSLQSFDKELLVATVKLDGTSLTAFYDSKRVGDEFGVCSRNQELKDMSGDETAYGFKIDTYWAVAKANQLMRKCHAIADRYHYDRVAIQAELCGPGIQGNKLGLIQHTPYMFDIYYEKDGIGQYMDYENVIAIAAEMNITMVPVVSLSSVLDDFGNPPDFSRFWTMTYPISGHIIEGVVFVSRKEQYGGPKLHRVKFKVINPNFLLLTEKE